MREGDMMMKILNDNVTLFLDGSFPVVFYSMWCESNG